ncbi:MAG TPA: IPT/TIG domain-containing protein [Longimicrobium sp.]|nr:IPT/TIG domain-containing protein [Longimicrobium sp.]
MSAPFPRRTRSAALRLLLAGLPVLAACNDSGTGNDLRKVEDLPLPRGTVAVLQCTARVASATLECEPGKAPGGAAQKNGPRATLRVMGGQGTYVRLTSSGNAYNAGTQTLSFNVTVQNLTTLAFGTADGAARHDDGVRVFFASGPDITAGSTENPVTVLNHDGTATFTATNQKYFQYGGKIGGADQTELGGDGVLATAEVSSAKGWQISVPTAVTTFTFTLYVATETPAGTVASAAPQVTSVSPATLVPGSTATLTGVNFNATPGSNAVTIGGRTAAVTGGNTTQLTVTVPCVGSGNVPVRVTQGGMMGASYEHPLQVTQRNVGVGQALVLTSSSESACNELPATGGAARYIVSVFSASTSPSTNAAATPFVFSADNGAESGELAQVQAQQPALTERVVGAPTRMTLDGHMEMARQQVADERHMWLLEENRREGERLRAHFASASGRAAVRAGRLNRNVISGDPPLNRTFRIANVAGAGFCNSFYVVSATRVYYNGKVAIYEDDATPDAFKGSLNANMATYYQQIGDQYNADMEPVVRNNFGDILLRDAELDNNGVEIALFTPRINTSFAGFAGFVVSCDQQPNDDASTPAVGGPYTGTGANGSSNVGEVFYAYLPTDNATGYSTLTPQNWYRTIRSTFIHESKHLASYVARVENGAPFEAGWLEEGTARHSEELWIRTAVDPMAWKANNGYGSAANPINIYCDVRPEGWPECLTNPRRPANGMNRHFGSLYTHMASTNARLLSPFGATSNDTQNYYYAISWSLVRYAIDRYGASDAAFLTALNNATTTGATNLAARANVSIDQLLGGWSLTLAADDHPLLAAAPSADIQFPTWNMRNIYAGYNADFAPGSFAQVYPAVPAQFSFGSFTGTAITTLRGGGFLWYELSGNHTSPQLLRLETNTGGQPSSTMRVAITRIQ